VAFPDVSVALPPHFEEFLKKKCFSTNKCSPGKIRISKKNSEFQRISTKSSRNISEFQRISSKI